MTKVICSGNPRGVPPVTCSRPTRNLTSVNMAFTSLLVCSDAEAVQVLTRILKDMGIAVENCGDSPTAALRLSEQRFDVLVVDCADEAGAVALISRARDTILNRSIVAIALLDSKNSES